MTALLPVLLLQLGQGLAVETDSPDALCPDLHQTRAAVNARLGAIGRRGFRARYTIVHEQGDIPRDFVLLELFSPEGEVRVRRELPIGTSCAAVADAIALVLDEYFRALVTHEDAQPTRPPEQRHAASTPPASPAPPPASSGAPRSATQHRELDPVEDGTHESPWLLALELAAVSLPSGLAAGMRLQAPLPSDGHWALELSVPLRDRVEHLPAGGDARARAFEGHAQLGWGPRLGSVRPYAGPTVFALLERARTTQPLASRTQYRVLAGAGVELGVFLGLSGPWVAGAFASGGRILLQTATFVAGAREVLDGRTWTGRAGLRVAYAF